MSKIIENSEDKIVLEREDGTTITFEKDKNTKEIKKFTPEQLKIIDNQMAKAAQLLCMEKPFYGYLLMGLIKEFGYEIPTMGIRTVSIHHEMYINPVFWVSLLERHRQGLIEHELNHVVYFHTTNDWSGYDNQEALAIALDLVVNQYIESDKLPEDAQTLDKYPTLNLEKERDAAYYYGKLNQCMKNPQSGKNKNENTLKELKELCDELGKSGDKIEESGTLTDSKGNKMKINLNHKDFGKNSETGETLNDIQRELINNQTKQVLLNAVEQTKMSRGTVPSHIIEVIEKITKVEPPRFNYHKWIRRFVGHSEKNVVISTRMRPNLIVNENPGTKTYGMQNVLVGLDVSGSVSTNLITNLQTDWNWLIRKGYDMDLAQFDTELHDVRKYKKNSQIKLVGRGGTDFNDICEFFKENQKKYTCLIVFSDGYCPPPDKDATLPGQRILWCFTCDKHEQEKDFPGQVIYIDEELKINK